MTEERRSVRWGGPDDAVSLKAIRLEALADTPEAYGSTYEEVSAWPDERWLAVAGQWRYVLGALDAAVAGLARGGFNDQRPGTHWLYGMYVSPGARGTGLAHLLVERVGEWAKGDGATDLYLHVGESVARARAFYAREGFMNSGNVITMDRDPSVRLLTMVKRLA
jgi:GNAT superfamily N-acetyltransferase